MHAVMTGFLLSIALTAAPQPPVIVLSEGAIHKGQSWSFGPNGEIILPTAPGTEASQPLVIPSPIVLDTSAVPFADRLHVPAGTQAASRPLGTAPATTTRHAASGNTAIIQLTNGETLCGTIRDAATPETICVDVERLGTLQVPIAQVAMILLRGRASIAGADRRATTPPYLVLTNGDVIGGVIRAIKPGSITIASEFGDTDMEMSRVSEAVLTPQAPALDGRRSGQVIVAMADGQRWYVESLAAGATPDLVHLRRGETSTEVAVRCLRQIVFAGWTVRDLTLAGKPAVETTPYLTETVRVEIDDATHRRPRAIDNRWFAGGITAHPRSRITYTTTAGTTHFIGWVGLDPLRGRHGTCDVRIEIPNAPGVSFEGLTAAAGAHRIAALVPNASPISLVTDFGRNGEIGDCVNWCELTLIERRREE